MQKEYHVDLAGLMRVYETNYAKMNSLLPIDPTVGDTRSYQVSQMAYQLEIKEITRYTTLVDVCQCDARVAEVCASEQISRVEARYDYPNKRMMQKDEKFQVNQFLGEWLSFCLRHGISRAPIY